MAGAFVPLSRHLRDKSAGSCVYGTDCNDEGHAEVVTGLRTLLQNRRRWPSMKKTKRKWERTAERGNASVWPHEDDGRCDPAVTIDFLLHLHPFRTLKDSSFSTYQSSSLFTSDLCVCRIPKEKKSQTRSLDKMQGVLLKSHLCLSLRESNNVSVIWVSQQFVKSLTQRQYYDLKHFSSNPQSYTPPCSSCVSAHFNEFEYNDGRICETGHVPSLVLYEHHMGCTNTGGRRAEVSSVLQVEERV